MQGWLHILLENKNLFPLWDILIRISLFLGHHREPLEALSLKQQGVNIPDRNPSFGKSAFNESSARHPILSQRAANRLRALETTACAILRGRARLPPQPGCCRRHIPGLNIPVPRDKVPGRDLNLRRLLLLWQLLLREAGRCGRKGRRRRPDAELGQWS